MDSIQNEILAHLTQLVGKEPKLSDSLAIIGIDSVGMAELTFEIERRFGIRVDEDVVEVETVDELIGYVKAKIK